MFTGRKSCIADTALPEVTALYQHSRTCACFLPALGQKPAARGKLSLKKSDFSIKADKLYPIKKLWKTTNFQQKGHHKNQSGSNNRNCRSCFF